MYLVHRKWRAQYQLNGKTHVVGSFDDEEEAARALDAEVKAKSLGFPLNFLPNGSLNPERRVFAKKQPYVGVGA